MNSEQQFISELMETMAFKKLVDIRSRQINENLYRYCEDLKKSKGGVWSDEIFSYRPGQTFGDRKDQWQEIKDKANFFLNKFPKAQFGIQLYDEYEWSEGSRPFLNYDFRTETYTITPLGERLRSLLREPSTVALSSRLGRRFLSQQLNLNTLETLLNDAVFLTKSEEKWKEEFKECVEYQKKFDRLVKTLTDEEKRDIRSGFKIIARDNNNEPYITVRKLTAAEIQANQEAEYRQAIEEYRGGKKYRTKGRVNRKSKTAKKGGKSRRHHKKTSRKTNRKH